MVKLFSTVPNNFSFGQMTMFKVFKRCLLSSYLLWKKIIVIGFVDQTIYAGNNYDFPKIWALGRGGGSFNACIARSRAAWQV